MSKLVRVSDAVYSKLGQIAQVTGYSRQDIIDKAVCSLERETILKQANQAYTRVASNKKGLQDAQEDLDLWESTLKDGLEDE
jgi:predicted transcriptional regulator